MAMVNNLGHIPIAYIKTYRTSTNQALSSSTWTAVSFNAEGTGMNATYRVTHTDTICTIQIAGWYIVTYHIVIDWRSGGNSREVRVKINDVVNDDLTATYPPISAGQERQAINCCVPMYLDVDDDLVVEVWQDSGSSITISGRDETFIKLLLK